MVAGDRKHTWVHVTYQLGGNIEIIFVTDRWHGHTFLRRHKRVINITRARWVRVSRLCKLLSYSPCVRYTIFAWNGFSVSYEKRTGAGIIL